MLQAVVLCSKKRFQITTQGDPIDVLSWLLNSLHLILGGTKKPDSSIIYKTFQVLRRSCQSNNLICILLSLLNLLDLYRLFSGHDEDLFEEDSSGGRH